MTQANTDFGVVAQDLGRAAAAFAVLTSSASAFGSALQDFRNFERQLTQTNAIAGGTVAQFEDMKNAARSFSLEFTTTAIDAGRALQQLAQAGFTAQESIQSLGGVLLLAQATFTDVAFASDVIASNLRAFKLEASDTTRVANVFTAATTSSLATIEKLAFAFRQVAPVARLANLSIEETTAFLNQLFNVGLRGEQAGTALRNVIIRLIRPMGEAEDILRQYGIAIRDVNGEMIPLVNIFRQLREAGVSNAELARIFETEALAAVATLLDKTAESAEGAASEYEKNLEAISGTDRALEIALENLDTLDGSLKLLANTISDIKKDIGEDFAPTVRFFADSLRNAAEAFRSLPQGVQTTIQALTAFAIVIGSSLAILNAFILVVGGPAARALGGFLGLIFRTRKSAEASGKSISLMSRAVSAMSVAFGGIITAIGPAIAAIGRFIGVAVSLTPQGRIVRGLIFIGGLLASTAIDWRNWGNAAEEAINKADMEKFNTAREQAAVRAEDIIPQDELDELANKAKRIRQIVDQARETQAPLDNIATGTRQGLRSRVGGETTDDAINDLQEESRELERVRQILREFDRDIAAAQAEFDSLGFFERFGVVNFADTLRGAREDFIQNLDAEIRGSFAGFEDKINDARETTEQFSENVLNAEKLRRESIVEFLRQLANPEENELQGALEIFGDDVQQLADRENVFKGALEQLLSISTSDVVTAEDFVTALINVGGTKNQKEALAAYLNRDTAQRVTDINQLIEGSSELFDQQFQQTRVQILRREAAQAKTVAEAVEAARAAGFIELEQELAELGAKNAGKVEELLNGFSFDTVEGFKDAVESAFADAGVDPSTLESIPGFAELFSGQFLLDSINKQIDESTTDEEAQAIIEAESAKIEAIMANLIAFLEEGILKGVSDEALAALENTSKQAVTAAIAAALSGLNAVSDEGDDAAESTRRRLKRSSGGGKKGKTAEQLAKEALRDARRIEDAFTEAEKAVLDAKTTFAENAFGLIPDARASTLLGLDVQSIEADFDRQIQRLERKLEDLEIDFKGSPQQLAELQDQTRIAIRLTEQAKQAEIEAATSFEAQMNRRSEALDLFIRDLETLAFQSEDTFTKVAAGIGKAFAEYQKDLVTLVDITANAMTGFLDTITTGVADFIFDNENAWENFKANMLNISREIFEGFTKALLQQAISSLTDGGGSILGNILQPSKVLEGDPRNKETPSVGTGGFLGRLFGGGDQSGTGQPGGPNAQPIQAGVQQVATVLQQGAVQIQGAIQQLSTATSGGGTQQRVAANQAANDTRQGGQATGQALNETARTVGQANRNIAAQSSAGASNGGGSGFFSSLLSAGLGLIGFANGGMVSDRPINNFIRNYAEGGQISGPGTGTSDDILAFLSNGEFVVNAKATSEFQPLLEAINNGAIKGDTAKFLLNAFREGGRVNSREMAPAFSQGGLVGDTAFGPPAVNLTEPRNVLVGAGTSNNPSISNINNSRGGDTININVSYIDRSGGDSAGSTRGRKSADQLAKRIGRQVERSRKNT